MPTVEVVPYHDGWSDDFASARGELDGALGPAVNAIHHIGSTSVPGLSAKPVIDILVETPSLTMIDDLSGAVEALGYEARGEYGIPGRRYFSRPKGRGPKVHVHAFASGSAHLGRHLRFRDFLRRHPDEAGKYAALKRGLAARFADDPGSYQAGKAELIREIEVRARADEVQAFFVEHAGQFGFHGDAIEVRPVFSRGGFVNRSFRVSDGRRDLHLKLAVSADAREALARWHGLGDALERHHAPPVLDSVRIGESSGLVFPVVRGSIPEFSDDVMRAVLDCLKGLWSDGSIVAQLPNRDGRTAANCYLGTYHDRFTGDLRSIQTEPPPFLQARDLELMETEVERLRETVESDPAFGELLSTPIHGDLWLDNIVWESAESWHIVDWDDLQIGDPAMDVAMLTGPTSRDPAPLKRLEMLGKEFEPELAHRVRLLGRASLLDWVIDPLADWIEAAGVVAPDREAAVRKEKERIHRSALKLYRSLYDGA